MRVQRLPKGQKKLYLQNGRVVVVGRPTPPGPRITTWRIGHWTKACIGIVVAFIIAVIAFYTQYFLLKLLNVVAWLVADYFLFRSLFHYVNRIDMYNDLKYVVVKVIGIVLATGGIIGFIIFFIGGVFYSLDPVTIGISILLLGVALLGLFMLFRLKRRYSVLGIHKA